MTPERFQNGSGTVPERFRNGSGPGCVLLVFLVLCFVLPFGAGWIGCRQDKPSLNRSKPRVWEKKAKERAASNPGPNYSEALSAKTLALFNRREIDKLDHECAKMVEALSQFRELCIQGSCDYSYLSKLESRLIDKIW